MWLGKILGGAFGFFIFGLIGAAIGVFIGHYFDKNSWSYSGQNAHVKQAFFKALFSVMGALAKVDGKVTKNEITVARQIMQHMQLNDKQKNEAIALFNEGKQPTFTMEPVLNNLLHVCRNRRNLLRMFMQLLLQAAHADGEMQQVEDNFLQQVAKCLGFATKEYQRMSAMFKAQYQFRQNWGNRGYNQQQYQQARPTKSNLKQAYAVLGVPETASMEEVKKAYRKLINQYHPDKLVAKGLPDEMMKVANEKTQEIKEAYELIKKAKS